MQRVGIHLFHYHCYNIQNLQMKRKFREQVTKVSCKLKQHNLTGRIAIGKDVQVYVPCKEYRLYQI